MIPVDPKARQNSKLKDEHIKRLLRDDDGFPSLARIQFFSWTVVILFCFAWIYFVRLANGVIVAPAAIPTDILALMGISAGATVASVGVSSLPSYKTNRDAYAGKTDVARKKAETDADAAARVSEDAQKEVSRLADEMGRAKIEAGAAIAAQEEAANQAEAAARAKAAAQAEAAVQAEAAARAKAAAQAEAAARAKAAAQAEAAALAEAAVSEKVEAYAKAADQARLKAQEAAVAKKKAKSIGEDSWGSMFLEHGNASLGRVQMFAWTVLSLAIYSVLVAMTMINLWGAGSAKALALPDIDPSLLVLMGISQAGYLGSKVAVGTA